MPPPASTHRLRKSSAPKDSKQGGNMKDIRARKGIGTASQKMAVAIPTDKTKMEVDEAAEQEQRQTQPHQERGGGDHIRLVEEEVEIGMANLALAQQYPTHHSTSTASPPSSLPATLTTAHTSTSDRSPAPGVSASSPVSASPAVSTATLPTTSPASANLASSAASPATPAGKALPRRPHRLIRKPAGYSSSSDSLSDATPSHLSLKQPREATTRSGRV
ncbi:hypothetical protein IAR50_007181 [Cryptococcus sp. DSM 104548]